jgi:thiamine transport system permease protein
VPLLRPALTKAAGLAAAISLGEFGATSFLSRSGSTTIPIAIDQLLSHPGSVMPQSAFALAAITIVVVSVLI